jgi:predicted O-linked N-acetylglucosamine transferase (SPINDLY family)
MSFSLQKKIREAEKLIKLNEYSKARDLYLDILAKFPNNIKALRALKTLKVLHVNEPVDISKSREFNKLLQQYNNKEFKNVIKKADELIKIYPYENDLHNIQGASNAALSMFDKAIICYKKILKINPNSARAYFNIAVMYDKLKSPKNAIKNYTNATKIKSDHADAYNNMGSAYKELGDLDKALNAYQKATLVQPNHAFAYNNMGNIYKNKGEHKKSIHAFEKAILFKKNYMEAFNNLAHALHDIGKNNEAIKVYDKILEIQPANEKVIALRNFLLRSICKWEKIEKDTTEISKLGISSGDVAPFTLMSLEDSPERHKLRAMAYTEKKFPRQKLQEYNRPRAKKDYIRVGYMSSDFKTHPVAFLIAKTIENHNRKKFKVYGYSIGPVVIDKMNIRLQKAFDNYKEVGHETDEQIATIIRRDKIDILIDLNGYTRDRRTGVMCLRPANIQISYLGYPGSMGAKFIDYIVADQNLIPESFQRFYSEKPIYLPYHYQAQDDKLEIAPERPTRSSLGLPEKDFVFCAINNTYKISPREFNIWMRLLHKIEGSVLWLYESNKFVKDNLFKEASARGITQDRLIFAKRVPHENYLAQLSQANLYLDTFNYNAGATASNALWAGLPVLTKQGKSYAARMASSLLKSLGMSELITRSELDYERLALELAKNPDKLNRMKQKLLKNKKSMPLFNTELFTRHLENGYEQAYQKSLKGEKPDTIIVPE